MSQNFNITLRLPDQACNFSKISLAGIFHHTQRKLDPTCMKKVSRTPWYHVRIVIYYSNCRILLYYTLKVNEIGASVEKEINDTSTPDISYKDYLDLWEFLLEKSKFKVWYLLFIIFVLGFVINLRIYHYTG